MQPHSQGLFCLDLKIKQAGRARKPTLEAETGLETIFRVGLEPSYGEGCYAANAGVFVYLNRAVIRVGGH